MSQHCNFTWSDFILNLPDRKMIGKKMMPDLEKTFLYAKYILFHLVLTRSLCHSEYPKFKGIQFYIPKTRQEKRSESKPAENIFASLLFLFPSEFPIENYLSLPEWFELNPTRWNLHKALYRTFLLSSDDIVFWWKSSQILLNYSWKLHVAISII